MKRASMLKIICVCILSLVGLCGLIIFIVRLYVHKELSYYRKDPPTPGWQEFKEKMNNPALPSLADLMNDLDSSSVAERVYAVIRIREISLNDSAIVDKLIERLAEQECINAGIEYCFRCKSSDAEHYCVGEEAMITLRQWGDLSVLPLIDFLNRPYHNQTKLSDVGFYLAKTRALEILLQIPQPRVYEALVSFLEYPSDDDFIDKIISNMQESVFKQFTQEQQTRCINALVNHLNNQSSDWIRVESAKALGRLKDPLAITALTRALDDVAYDVRFLSVAALSQFQTEKALKILMDTLLNSQSDYSLRQAAANHLRNYCSSPQVREALKQVMSDPAVFVLERKAAKETYNYCSER